MQGLRIIFFPTILILRYFYSHQLIGIFPESFFMNARPEAERPISTFNFPFLFFGLGRSSVNHGFLFCLSCSVCACAVVFSCCFALVSLLLLCSCVPSPAVLCVHRPLRSLLNSHAPFFFDGPNSLLHPLALSLAHATSLSPLFHRLLFVWSHWIVLSPSPSNRSNELDSSGTYF